MAAQDLEYTSTTQMKGAGALGPMAMGMRSMSMQVFLKARKLRLDFGTTSTIVDGGSHQILMLDHAHRTYAILPLERLPQAETDSMAKAVGAVASVQTTRQVQKINGIDARLTNVIARVPARNPKAAKASDVVVINELWTSNANGMGAAYEKLSELADRFGLNASMLMALVGQNQQVAGGMQSAARAAARVRGLPIRRTNAYGLVPADSKFQPGMAMDTMMAVVTDLTNVRKVKLPPATFEIPGGYKKTEGRRTSE